MAFPSILMNRNCLANEASSSTGYSLLKPKKMLAHVLFPNSESIGYRIDWTVGTSSTFPQLFLEPSSPSPQFLEPTWNLLVPPKSFVGIFQNLRTTHPPQHRSLIACNPIAICCWGKIVISPAMKNPVYPMNPNPGPKHGQLCKFSLSKSLGKEFPQQPSQTTKRRKRPPKIATPYRSERKCKFRQRNKPSGDRKDTFSIALSSKGTVFLQKKNSKKNWHQHFGSQVMFQITWFPTQPSIHHENKKKSHLHRACI